MCVRPGEGWSTVATNAGQCPSLRTGRRRRWGASAVSSAKRLPRPRSCAGRGPFPAVPPAPGSGCFRGLGSRGGAPRFIRRVRGRGPRGGTVASTPGSRPGPTRTTVVGAGGATTSAGRPRRTARPSPRGTCRPGTPRAGGTARGEPCAAAAKEDDGRRRSRGSWGPARGEPAANWAPERGRHDPRRRWAADQRRPRVCEARRGARGRGAGSGGAQATVVPAPRVGCVGVAGGRGRGGGSAAPAGPPPPLPPLPRAPLPSCLPPSLLRAGAGAGRPSRGTRRRRQEGHRLQRSASGGTPRLQIAFSLHLFSNLLGQGKVGANDYAGGRRCEPRPPKLLCVHSVPEDRRFRARPSWDLSALMLGIAFLSYFPLFRVYSISCSPPLGPSLKFLRHTPQKSE